LSPPRYEETRKWFLLNTTEVISFFYSRVSKTRVSYLLGFISTVKVRTIFWKKQDCRRMFEDCNRPYNMNYNG
jgi:hypothetical protein